MRRCGLAALRRLAPELILLAVAGAAAVRTTDPDLWGHIRFGQEMLARRSLLSHDPYSYSALGHAWRDHEWLTEVVMALGYEHFGVIGIKLWKLTCSAAVLLLLALGVAETAAPARLQLALLAIVAVAMAPFMQFRPQLFSFVIFAAVLAVFARHNYRGHAPLWVVIPLMALWANLHGGFLIGIVTLWVYAGVGLVENAIWNRTARFDLLLLAVCGTLATVVTPYGRDTWVPVVNALKNPLTRSIIDDWKPPVTLITGVGRPNYGFIFFCLYAFGLIAALALTLGLTRVRGDLPLVAIALVMAGGAWAAVRNLPLAAIACAAPVARHAAILQQRKQREWDPPTEGVVSSATRCALAFLVLALAVGRESLFSKLLPTDSPYPSGPVEFMRRHGLHGNVLCHFGWGEYLIWHLAPSSKVFIDGRYDTVYPLSVIEDYVKFHYAKPGADRVLYSYPHDFVLIPVDTLPYGLMEKSPGWKLVYRDRDCALFAREGSRAATLPGIPVISSAGSARYFP